jgi:phosphoglycolate phosphatase
MPADFNGVTVVFDLDGTLVHTAPDLAAATSHALSLAGVPPVSVSELLQFVGHGSRAMLDAGLRKYGKGLSEAEISRLHEAFLTYYADNVSALSEPFNGVIDVLDALAAGGAKLAVCTNKMENLSKLLLKDLGMDRRFAFIAGRDTFDVFKPAPGHLTKTIAAAGGTPDRAVMVGDSEVDIATAIAAGIPSIAVTFGYTTLPIRDLGASAVIDHYREFLGALEHVLGATAARD